MFLSNCHLFGWLFEVCLFIIVVHVVCQPLWSPYVAFVFCITTTSSGCKGTSWNHHFVLRCWSAAQVPTSSGDSGGFPTPAMGSLYGWHERRGPLQSRLNSGDLVVMILQTRVHHRSWIPYAPCMVYLPTFGWFLGQMVPFYSIHGAYGYGVISLINRWLVDFHGGETLPNIFGVDHCLW